MNASFSNFSFVQFELPSAVPQFESGTSAGCCPDPAFCLPLSSASNLQFYLYLSGVYPNSAATRLLCFAYAVPVTITAAPDLTAYNPYSSTAGTAANPYPLLFANHFNPSLPGGGTMTLHFDYPWGSYASMISVGECFKLMIAYLPADVSSGSVGETWPMQFIGFTNCFQRTDASSTCYSSVVTYSNNSDAFDFEYLWGKPNSVELPIYLRDPQMENDQKVYVKSDGTIVKLYERKEEVYMLETDLMPYAWHKALDIALSHDNVAIQNRNATTFDPTSTTHTITTDSATTGGVTTITSQTTVLGNPANDPTSISITVSGTFYDQEITLTQNNALNFAKKENYEIEYQKAPLSALGKGSCKLSNSQAIHLINNNCA